MNLENHIFKHDYLANKKDKKNSLLKTRILHRVYLMHTCTIAELATATGLSLPTVNTLVSELIHSELLTTGDKGESIGGRKPTTYQLSKNIFQTICVEIERFSVRILVLDNDKEVVFPEKTYQNTLSTKSSDAYRIIEILENYINEFGINPTDFSAIGILMPGLIDYRDGSNKTFYAGNNFSLRDFIAAHFDKYVALMNDVKSAATSELAFGAARGRKNALSIMMDWGIGLGIITDGRIYMGNDGFTGEVGHLIFVEDGELCYCGKRGCLETVASGLSLVSKAKKDIAEGVPTFLNKFDLTSITPKIIIKSANEGDQYSIDLIAQLGKNLGKAISFLIQILNPELIVLAGKFAAAGDLITIPIQQSINSYTMKTISKNCEVVVSNLDKNGNANGMARYAIDQFFLKSFETKKSIVRQRNRKLKKTELTT